MDANILDLYPTEGGDSQSWWTKLKCILNRRHHPKKLDLKYKDRVVQNSNNKNTVEKYFTLKACRGCLKEAERNQEIHVHVLQNQSYHSKIIL